MIGERIGCQCDRTYPGRDVIYIARCVRSEGIHLHQQVGVVGSTRRSGRNSKTTVTVDDVATGRKSIPARSKPSCAVQVDAMACVVGDGGIDYRDRTQVRRRVERGDSGAVPSEYAASNEQNPRE